MRSVTLDGKKIGETRKPYFIAEMSGNHNNSLELALKMVESAKEAGADAFKVQTFTADSMTLDLNEGDFVVRDESSLWYGKTLYELYKESSLPRKWHIEIQKKCKELGITFFSTPFDSDSVDFLEELNVPFYKIASFENTDLLLLRKIAKTKKPVIISTGMATLSEVSEIVENARELGISELVLLKCTSAYPAKPSDANLMTIRHMKETFGIEVGLSDHTMDVGVAIAAVSLGASVVEKHFVLDRALGGVDSAFSMEPDEFSLMVKNSVIARSAIGEIKYGKDTEDIKKSKRFKRSLYLSIDIKEGELFTEEHIKAIRPGGGLETKYYEIIVGKTAKKSFQKGQPISWDMF